MPHPDSTFRILPRRSQRADGGWHVDLEIQAGARHQCVSYDFPAALGEPETDDAVVPMGLFAAMAHGLPFVAENPVDARLAEEALVAMDIAAEWWPDALAPVPVDLPVRADMPVPPDRGRAAFFTGGMDSWHTLLNHEHKISHLIYVHGFDMPGRSAEDQALVGRRVREAAAARGFALQEIHTNHREQGEHLVGDFKFSHGAMLAAVGLMLGKSIDGVYIAASDNYIDMVPWGSMWFLDPLWTTGKVQILYDGADTWRSDKAHVFARHPDLLAHLVVCWDGYVHGKNCGHCEKCLRTMLALHFAGIDDLSPAFAQALDPMAIATMRLTSDWRIANYAKSLKLAREHRPDSPILPAFESCVRENKARVLLRELADLGDIPIEPSPGAKLLRGLRDPLWNLWSATARDWLGRRLGAVVHSNPTRAQRVLWS